MIDKRISWGNILTVLVIAGGFVAQWGAWQKTVEELDRRLAAVEHSQSEFRKDTRVVEALQRVAVIENNVLWIRSVTEDIKAQVSKKGAQ